MKNVSLIHSEKSEKNIQVSYNSMLIYYQKSKMNLTDSFNVSILDD
jgi:hypothetical protein